MSTASDNKNKTMHIDFASLVGSVWYFAGWVVSKYKQPNLQISEKGNALSLMLKCYEREDLSSALNLDEGLFGVGFVLVVRAYDSEFNDLTFYYDETEMRAEELAPTFIDSPDIILDSLGESVHSFKQELEKAQLFLGEEVNQNSNFALQTVHYHFDSCFVTSDNLLYINGWVLSNNDSIQLEVLGTDGQCYKITEGHRYFRHDIVEKYNLQNDTKAGLVSACRLPNGISPKQLKVSFSEFAELTVNIDKSNYPKQELLKNYLSLINVHDSNFFELKQPVIIKHLADIWNSGEIMVGLEPKVSVFGSPENEPLVSVIIPIYGRYDFLQHQLMFFSTDSDMNKHEIIYVLDDPRIEKEFNITCHGVFNTFKQPFKTVYANKNLGFAGANNLGVSVAKGEYILALNSDVLPSERGWLSRLVNKYATLACPGILGSTLIYEDDTIQHIGMEFQADPHYPGIWMNFHPHKGVPKHLVGKGITELVELVTGACMLMERSLFIDIGGFDTKYILGDFEDSDLCLKVYEKGRKIYLDTEESLYHLERLSQSLVDSGDWKYKLTLLNGLYQREKWGEFIKEVKQKNV
ncbi:glycosyltransferase family 2 protein [Pseudoalteromonas lipolytica]